MSDTRQQILEILGGHMSAILARSVLSLSISWSKVDPNRLRPGDDNRLLAELEKGCRLYVRDDTLRQTCMEQMQTLLTINGHTLPPPEEPPRLTRVPVLGESDIVDARGIGRLVCNKLGFSGAMQIKVATAISELARNIVQYADKGEITITTLNGNRRGIEVVARDEGPGIADISLVMSDRYNSRTGMGIGLKGTRNLMDEFDLKSTPGKGTEIRVRKYMD